MSASPAAWPSPLALGFTIATIAFLGILLWRAALPRPVPGIPYNPESGRRLFGDIPDMLRWKAEHGDTTGYLPQRARDLDSPIFQLFVKPGGKPWVFVYDARETHDVLTRRFRDFDRSNYFGGVFKALLPRFHVHMPTGEEWHVHRRLMHDTMSSTFLHSVAAPQMWATTQSLIRLWREKTRLADGRPFSAAEDVHRAALDIVWAATFGEEIGSNSAQANHLAAVSTAKHVALDQEAPTTFPHISDPPAFTSIMTLSESMNIPTGSPFPIFHHWLALTFVPKYAAARREKDAMVKAKLQRASNKFSRLSADHNIDASAGLTSAVDLVIAQEIKMATKEGRHADLDSSALRDELFGFLIAGHETTSTAVCWALKFLVQHQPAQTHLRTALRAYHVHAAAGGTSPSVDEITRNDVPYLEAVIAESLRCGQPTLGAIRLALNDVELLGCLIPRGTDVFFMHNGPGCLSLPIPVQDSRRSPSARAAPTRFHDWSDPDIGLFRPERWLVSDPTTGQLVFNPDAGPSNFFGGGPRGCFGRKWALLELRILLTSIFWHFELCPIPDELASFKAKDGVTHQPVETYVRLKEV